MKAISKYNKSSYTFSDTGYGNILMIYRFSTVANLADHLKVAHSWPMSIESMSFNAFRAWKSDTERKTHSFFVQNSSKKKCGNLYLDCDRSGIYTSKGKGKWSLKNQGSNKICVTCTSYIIIAHTMTS